VLSVKLIEWLAFDVLWPRSLAVVWSSKTDYAHSISQGRGRASVKLRNLPQDTSVGERVEYLGLPGVTRHSVKLRTLPQDTSRRERVEHPGLPGVLRHSIKLRTLPQDTSLRERVEHPGLPGVLRHSVKLRTSTS
jgi:hypothetical protein